MVNRTWKPSRTPRLPANSTSHANRMRDISSGHESAWPTTYLKKMDISKLPTRAIHRITTTIPVKRAHILLSRSIKATIVI